MMVRGIQVTVFVAALCGGMACDPEPGRRAHPAARSLTSPEVTGSFAHLQIRGLHHWSPPPGEPSSRLELWAVFVEHEGIGTEAAAQQLGVPPPGDDLAEGQCRRVADTGLLRELDPELDTVEASTELLDAGALYFRFPAQSHLVRPRLYPEVLPHISGVEYRKVLRAPRDGISTRRVSVLGLGGREVSTFELMQQVGPEELRIRTVGGAASGDGPVTLAPGAPLVVRWTPAQPSFRVRVRFSWPRGVGHGAGAVECRPRRPGEMTIPARWLRATPAGAWADALLEIRIEQQVDARIPGMERATLLLSQSDRVSVSLER